MAQRLPKRSTVLAGSSQKLLKRSRDHCYKQLIYNNIPQMLCIFKNARRAKIRAEKEHAHRNKFEQQWKNISYAEKYAC